jgi:hypothetical protein
MATVQNYLNGLGNYYHIEPEQHRRQNGSGGGYASSAVNFVPAFGFGGGGYGGSNSNVTVIGGTDVMRQNREYQIADRNDNRASGAAWMGGILTIIGAAGFAYVLKNWTNTRDELKKAHQIKQDQIPFLDTREEKAKVMSIVNQHINNLEKQVSRQRVFVVLTGLALATAATAFAAGMVAAQWLITAAIVVGVITLAVGAFTAVWCAMDKTEVPTGLKEIIRAHQLEVDAP